MRPLSPTAQQVRWTSALVAAAAVWVACFVLVFSAVQEQRQQSSLFAQFRQKLADGTAPVAAPIPQGRPVALLDIPAIGLRRTVVVQGSSSAELRSGPGHLPSTVLPGQAGVSVVLGRALAFGGPFRDLSSLRSGDEIDATSGTGRAIYRVDRVRRPGDPLPPPLASGAARLSLVTLSRGHGLRALSPGHLVVVDATLLGQAAPAGAVGASTAAERPSARDTGGLAVLVLALELLLAVVAGVVVASARWGGLRVWVLGGPALIAALWASSDVAVRLLPNLY